MNKVIGASPASAIAAVVCAATMPRHAEAKSLRRPSTVFTTKKFGRQTRLVATRRKGTFSPEYVACRSRESKNPIAAPYRKPHATRSPARWPHGTRARSTE
ncbi:MAG: hypothetical protein ACYS99_07665 [Planctomycetota bacterium]|jgi:hypothetical protein